MLEDVRAAQGAISKLKHCILVENVDFVQEARPLDLRGRGLISVQELRGLAEQWGCALNEDELDTLRRAFGSSVGVHIGKLNCALDLKVSPDFIVDPSLMFDRLPQPYRMIDKILRECIVGPVLDTIDEEERRVRQKSDKNGASSLQDAATCLGTRHMADIAGLTCIASLTNSSASCNFTNNTSSNTDQDSSHFQSGPCFAGTKDGHIVIIDDVRAVSEPIMISTRTSIAPCIADLACVRRPSDNTILVLAALHWENGRHSQIAGNNNSDSAEDLMKHSSGSSVVVLKLFALATTHGQRLKPLFSSQEFQFDQVTRLIISKDASRIAIAANDATQIHVFEIPADEAMVGGGLDASNVKTRKSGVSEVRESDENTHGEEDDEMGDMNQRDSSRSIVDDTTAVELKSCLYLQNDSGMFEVQLPVKMTRERYNGPWKLSSTCQALVLNHGSCSIQLFNLSSSNGDSDNRTGSAAQDKNTAQPRPVHEWFVHSQITSWSLHVGPPSEQCVIAGTADGSVFVWDMLSGAPRGRGSRRLTSAVTSVRMDGKDTLLVGGANGQVAVFTAPGTQPFGQQQRQQEQQQNEGSEQVQRNVDVNLGTSAPPSKPEEQQEELVKCNPKDWIWPLLRRSVNVPGAVKQLVVLPGTPLCFVVSLGSNAKDRPFATNNKSNSTTLPISDKWMVWACDVGSGMVIGKLEPHLSGPDGRRAVKRNDGGGGDGDIDAAAHESNEWLLGSMNNNNNNNNSDSCCPGDLHVLAGEGDRILVTCCTPLHNFNNVVDESVQFSKDHIENKKAEAGAKEEKEQEQEQEQEEEEVHQQQQPECIVHILAYTLTDLAKVLYPSVSRVCAEEPANGLSFGTGMGGVNGGFGGMHNMFVSPIQQLTQQNQQNNKGLKQVLRMTSATERNNPLAQLDHLDPSADPLDLGTVGGNTAFGAQSVRSKHSGMTKGAKSIGSLSKWKGLGVGSNMGRKSQNGGMSVASGVVLRDMMRSAGKLSPAASVTAMSMASGMFMSPSKQQINGPTNVEFRKVQGPVDVRQQAQEFLERRGETHLYRQAKLKQSIAQWMALAQQNTTFSA